MKVLNEVKSMLLVLVVSFIVSFVVTVEVLEGGAMVVVVVEVVEVVEVEVVVVVVVLYCCTWSMLMTPWVTQL